MLCLQHQRIKAGVWKALPGDAIPVQEMRLIEEVKTEAVKAAADAESELCAESFALMQLKKQNDTVQVLLPIC